MKIGIIGYKGVVGSAVFEGLSPHHKMVGFDIKDSKERQIKSYIELLKTEMVFICLPTPTMRSGQDMGVIERALQTLSLKKYEGIVVIKSTIVPGVTDGLHKQFKDLTIVHCPEFLSANSAHKDFKDQKEIVIGGWDHDSIRKVYDVHKPVGVRKAHVGTPTQIELIKYLHNVFLTVKVGIMNELYDVCFEKGCEFQPLMDVAADITGWINKRHIQVPSKGKFGYGGECFPKDIGALYEKFKFLNLDIIGACIESNNKRRKDAKNLLRRPLTVLEDKANGSKRTRRSTRQQGTTQSKVCSSSVAG